MPSTTRGMGLGRTTLHARVGTAVDRVVPGLLGTRKRTSPPVRTRPRGEMRVTTVLQGRRGYGLDTEATSNAFTLPGLPGRQVWVLPPDTQDPESSPSTFY